MAIVSQELVNATLQRLLESGLEGDALYETVYYMAEQNGVTSDQLASAFNTHMGTEWTGDIIDQYILDKGDTLLPSSQDVLTQEASEIQASDLSEADQYKALYDASLELGASTDDIANAYNSVYTDNTAVQGDATADQVQQFIDTNYSTSDGASFEEQLADIVGVGTLEEQNQQIFDLANETGTSITDLTDAYNNAYGSNVTVDEVSQYIDDNFGGTDLPLGDSYVGDTGSTGAFGETRYNSTNDFFNASGLQTGMGEQEVWDFAKSFMSPEDQIRWLIDFKQSRLDSGQGTSYGSDLYEYEKYLRDLMAGSPNINRNESWLDFEIRNSLLGTEYMPTWDEYERRAIESAYQGTRADLTPEQLQAIRDGSYYSFVDPLWDWATKGSVNTSPGYNAELDGDQWSFMMSPTNNPDGTPINSVPQEVGTTGGGSSPYPYQPTDTGSLGGNMGIQRFNPEYSSRYNYIPEQDTQRGLAPLSGSGLGTGTMVTGGTGWGANNNNNVGLAPSGNTQPSNLTAPLSGPQQDPNQQVVTQQQQAM